MRLLEQFQALSSKFGSNQLEAIVVCRSHKLLDGTDALAIPGFVVCAIKFARIVYANCPLIVKALADPSITVVVEPTDNI